MTKYTISIAMLASVGLLPSTGGKIRNFPIVYSRLFGIRERCILIPPD
jgi:hypothetical protein